PAEVAQILVRPCGPYLAIEARLLVLAVPSEPEAIAVRAGGGLECADALVDQRMARRGDIMLERDGFSAIGNPAAHGGISNRIGTNRGILPIYVLTESRLGLSQSIHGCGICAICAALRPTTGSS